MNTTLDECLSVVASVFGVEKHRIVSRFNGSIEEDARNAFYGVAYTMTGATLRQISSFIGRASLEAASRGVKRSRDLQSTDPVFRSRYMTAVRIIDGTKCVCQSCKGLGFIPGSTVDGVHQGGNVVACQESNATGRAMEKGNR